MILHDIHCIFGPQSFCHIRTGPCVSVMFPPPSNIGVVPPLSSLACEFVCQPSYNSPKTAQFLLTMENDHTHVGETEETNNVLTLVAEVSVSGKAGGGLWVQG